MGSQIILQLCAFSICVGFALMLALKEELQHYSHLKLDQALQLSLFGVQVQHWSCW